jgi:hypothetical protein
MLHFIEIINSLKVKIGDPKPRPSLVLHTKIQDENEEICMRFLFF